MAKLFSNSGDPDQMLQNVASNLGCTVCQLLFWGFQTKMAKINPGPAENSADPDQICH